MRLVRIRLYACIDGVWYSLCEDGPNDEPLSRANVPLRFRRERRSLEGGEGAALPGADGGERQACDAGVRRVLVRRRVRPRPTGNNGHQDEMHKF